MEGKSKLTQEEKRLKRIAQLKAMLQLEEAKQNQEERKRRTGSLLPLAFTLRNFFKSRMTRQKNGWKRVSKSTFQDEILSVH